MDTIQVYPQDLLLPIDDVRSRTFFINYASLDETRLKAALDKLIRSHWRKLGARFVRGKSSSTHAYHLPHTFKDGYTLFNWSSTTVSSSIEEATGLPTPSTRRGFNSSISKTGTTDNDGASLHGSLVKILEEFQPPKWPWHMASTPANSPLIWVHLTHFTNATVVGLNVPHLFSDQLGVANIVRVWMGVLRGEAPPAMVGFSEDIMAEEGKKSYHEYTAEEINRKGSFRIMGAFERMKVVLGLIPELVFLPEEEQLLFIPTSVVEGVREREESALRAKYGVDVRISSNDIVGAIVTKLIYMNQGKREKQLQINQAVNLRGRIASLSPAIRGAAYIHNSICYSTARFLYTSNLPLFEIAHHLSCGNKAATEPAYIQRMIAVWREHVRLDKQVHICEPWELNNFLSSWTAAWRDVDFTAAEARAVVDDADTDIGSSSSAEESGKNEENEERNSVSGGGGKVRMVVLGDCSQPKVPRRYAQYILSRSEEGFWCHVAVAKRTMDKIREHVKRDPRLEQL